MQLVLLLEVKPKPEAFDEYLAIAARLRPSLDESGGCLFMLAPRLADLAGAFRMRLCETERDYGMFDRSESPQYYPSRERVAH